MSFLLRSSSTRTWRGGGKSFSVRTGRKENESMVHGPAGAAEASREYLAATHFLRNEVAAAAAAVAALDRYQIKLNSFQEKGLELLEEAHRALSRLEQSVSTSAAPELIVVACEIKVACQRGLHLFRTYGRYRYFGKLVALATRSSTTAKYDAVIARLLAIMPKEQPGQDCNDSSSAAAGMYGAPQQQGSSSGSSSPRSGAAANMDRAATTSTTNNTVAAAAGVLERMLRAGSGGVSSATSSGNAAGATGAVTPGNASPGVLVRSGAHDRITSIAFVPPPDSLSAAACIWWAVGDKLEFYSSVTQSTTSFSAAAAERVAVAAITLDSVGNVWGGTVKGSVFMRRRMNWQQVFVERAFSTSVRVLAADADSDVVWAGDDSGRLAVFRCRQGSMHTKLECTATILPGKPGSMSLKGCSSPALVESRSRGFLGLRRSMSCRTGESHAESAEGPIRALLVRDDRAWVSGGRTEPWLALFDAVAGIQLDMWACGSYGCCHAMACMLTCAALAQQAVAPMSSYSTGLANGSSIGIDSAGFCTAAGAPGSGVIASVPEDGIGEQPRNSWRLITGHENGQLLLWSAALDKLQPLVKIGEPSFGPVRAVAVLEKQGLLAVVRSNGDLSLFVRPARDEDWMLPAIAGAPAGGSDDSNIQSQHPTSPYSSGGQQQQQQQSFLMTIRPRKVTLKAHRTQLAVAAACAAGVVTASNLGAVKLWSADALAKEANKGGLLLKQQQQQSLGSTALSSEPGSIASRSTTGSLMSRRTTTGDQTAAEQQQQQQLQFHQLQPSPRASFVSNHGCAGNTFSPQQHQQQQHGQGYYTHMEGYGPATGVYSELQPMQYQGWSGGSGGGTPCVQGNGTPRASVVIDIPSPAAASGVNSGVFRHGSDGSAMAGAAAGLSVETSAQARSIPLPAIPAHLSTTGLGSPGAPSSLSAATHGGFVAGPSSSPAGGLGSSFGPSSPGGFGGPGGLAGGFPDVITAPRAPKAQRLAASESSGSLAAMSRERRKSERRLSRGSQMQWSSCQMIESTELKLVSSIGSGAYGKVWLAEWMGTSVAVKELVSLQDKAKDEVNKRKAREAKRSPSNRKSRGQVQEDQVDYDGSEEESDDSIDEEVTQELKALMDEVYLLGSLTHPSISRFCAVCLDPPMIVMQYYPHGSMFDLLKKGRRGDKRALQELSWPKRLDMLRDVASGMVFLHSRRPPIVHGDLRSPNLLLDLTIDRDRPRYHVKIADFGLARMLGPASSIAVSKVTNPRWSAPEVIRSSTVSRAADVFSFGVVMWEMLTWQQPYEEMLSVQVLFSVMQQYRPEIPPEDELPGKPGTTLPKYLALMEACWAEDEAARPRFEDVVAALDELRAIDCVRPRSVAGSARASYTETGTPTCGSPTCGTPTGSSQFGASSSVCGQSPPPSMPCSAPNSAPTSQGAQAAALAAAAAAAANGTPMSSAGSSIGTAAAAGGVPADSATSIDDPAAALAAYQHANPAPGAAAGSTIPFVGTIATTPPAITASISNSLAACAAGPIGTLSAWRLASDPGTPTAAAPAGSGPAPGPLGDRKVQLAGVGSTPPTTAMGSASSFYAAQQCSPMSSPHSGSSSPGPFGGYGEPSFAVHVQQGAAGAAVPAAAAPAGAFPAAADRITGPLAPPPPAGRTPSRLGLRSSSSTAGSPNAAAAAAGVYVGLGISLPPINTGGSAGSPLHTSPYTSPYSNAGGRRPSDLDVSDCSAPASPSQAVAVVSPHHKGMSAHSPFAAAAGGGDNADATVAAMAAAPAAVSPTAVPGSRARPSSPFSAIQQPTAAAAAAEIRDAAVAVARPSSPFSAVQQPAAAEVKDAAPAVARPSSPFSAVQQPAAAEVRDAAAAVARPSSPFSAVQQPAAVDVQDVALSVSRPASPFTTVQQAAAADVRDAAAVARPSSPFSAVQQPAAVEVRDAAAAVARPASPFSAVQQPAAAEVRDVARPSSPFSAVQQPAATPAANSNCSPCVAHVPSRPSSPFAAAGRQQQQQDHHSAAVAAVARPSSPFAAAKQPAVQDWAAAFPVSQQQQQQRPLVAQLPQISVGAVPAAVAAAVAGMRATQSATSSESVTSPDRSATPSAAAAFASQHHQQLPAVVSQGAVFQMRAQLREELCVDSLGADSPFGLMQPAASNDSWMASPVSSPSNSASGPGLWAAAFGAAVAGSTAATAYAHASHSPSRLGKSNSAADDHNLPVVEEDPAAEADAGITTPERQLLQQQQAAQLDVQQLLAPLSQAGVVKAVSPFASMNLAEVEGPIVSQQVQAACAAATEDTAVSAPSSAQQPQRIGAPDLLHQQQQTHSAVAANASRQLPEQQHSRASAAAAAGGEGASLPPYAALLNTKLNTSLNSSSGSVASFVASGSGSQHLGSAYGSGDPASPGPAEAYRHLQSFAFSEDPRLAVLRGKAAAAGSDSLSGVRPVYDSITFPSVEGYQQQQHQLQ